MSELRVTLRPNAAETASDVLVARPDSVTLQVFGRQLRVLSGTALADVLPTEVNGSPIVAALLGRRPVSLTTRVSWDSKVEPVTLADLEGQRIYRLSQAMLLMEAAARIKPAPELRLVHSVGFGRRVRVAVRWRQDVERLAELLENTMTDLVAQDSPLIETWVGATEAMQYFRDIGWDDTVELLATWRDPIVPLSSFGKVHALVTSPLVPSTGKMSGFRVLPDRGGLLLLYGPRGEAMTADGAVQAPLVHEAPVAVDVNEALAERVDFAVVEGRSGATSEVTAEEALAVARQTLAMTQQQERWLETLDIRSVGAFNRACVSGNVGPLIAVSEGFHEKRISRIADEVHGRGRSSRVVCIAGPSSSGKTTFIKRLNVQLQVLGMRPVAISLDDYYCDRELTPKDGQGGYDFEALEALRLDLLRDHVSRLVAGEEVETARYDFKSGKSHPSGGPKLKLDTRSVLMLEGIHGLNPNLLAQIGRDEVFRVFICPLAQLAYDRVTRLNASDVRLVRRIVRDRHARGYNAAATIERWASVREGERRHIFPFQDNADAVFDSSLIYEIAVLKVYAERYLLEVDREHASWHTAYRLLRLLDRFVPLYPDRVPPTSILREFIGGSAFHY
jgi:uridine kinase